MHQNHALTRWWHGKGMSRAWRLVTPRHHFRAWTAGARPLPNLIIAGAQKAGTTSLFGYLAQHPQCAASLTKEVHFFDNHFSRGENWYRSNFPLTKSEKNGTGPRITLESSPYYQAEPRVPARVHSLLPGARLIFLLRNPVSRAYSHYQHNVMRRREPLSFADAVAAEPSRIDGDYRRMLSDEAFNSDAVQQYSYLKRGIYVDQLVQWRKYFPAEQMLVLQSERMFRNPGEVYLEVLQFLELDRWEPATYKNLYQGRYQEPMAADMRAELTEYFAPHNERLYQLLSWQSVWK